ncbi:MAG: PAS domain S-box protein [Phycisphaeraceae bacterium]
MTPAHLALGYLLLGVIWIVTSDAAMSWITGQGNPWVYGQIGKGVGFIVITAGLLWLLLVRYMQALAHSHNQLRESEERYRMIIETAMEGIVILNCSGEVTFANTQMAHLLNYRPADMLGRHVTEFVDPDVLPHVRAQLERRWQGEAAQYETRYMTQDGRRVWAIVTSQPIVDTHGEVTGALATVTDITQRIAAEEKLRESEQRYRDLADSRKLLLNELDHRVKNNLAGLHALLSMYARSAKTVDDFAEFMRQKLVAMTTVHEMIAAANWEPIRLSDLIRHTSEQFRGPGPEDLTISVDGPTVTIGPRQAGPLIMILHELFTNSRKHGAYSRSGGLIEISWNLREQDKQQRLLVLQWTESGGPEIREPNPAGLGLGLVQGFTQHELNGRFVHEFKPDGFRGTLEGLLEAVPAESADKQSAEAGAAPRHR